MGIYDDINDTIVAPATPPGISGVAVLRISGDGAMDVLSKIFSKKSDYQSHRLYHGAIKKDGVVVDDVMAAFMKGPGTYNGQDTVEIYCHGGYMSYVRVIDACIWAGCRLAGPGEFARRAFINGRVDLTEVEAVADLIMSSTDAAAQTAVNQVCGKLKKAILALQERLLDFIASIEAAVDYPEDDLEDAVSHDVLGAIGGIIDGVEDLLENASSGKVYREGVNVSITGRPNVGKSSLLNAILGEDRVIVTDVPGTTRDAVQAEISLRGVGVTFVDTAGIRKSSETIEMIGVERSLSAIQRADLVLLVLDGSMPLEDGDLALIESLGDKPHIVVSNKSDLPDAAGGRLSQLGIKSVRVSALKGDGIQRLLDELFEEVLSGAAAPHEAILSNVRHIDAVRRAHDALLAARRTLRDGMAADLATTDIRAAWRALGEVTGGTVDEDVVKRIFENFCVGK